MKDWEIKELEKAERIMQWQSASLWNFCVGNKMYFGVYISVIFLN